MFYAKLDKDNVAYTSRNKENGIIIGKGRLMETEEICNEWNQKHNYGMTEKIRNRYMFKAKCKHVFLGNEQLLGNWIEGYLSCDIYIYSPEKGEFVIDPDTICQYTGLTACWNDSNNVKKVLDIWEHDLLEVEYGGKREVAEVKYKVSK